MQSLNAQGATILVWACSQFAIAQDMAWCDVAVANATLQTAHAVQAAVDSMRKVLSHLDMDGVVVIGEGEKDEAPMLYRGEAIGTGNGLAVDVAVDPLDGTTLVANGRNGAVAVRARSLTARQLASRCNP